MSASFRGRVMSEITYEGVESLSSVREDFFFGKALPRASFPAAFAEQFDAISEDSFDDEKEHFVAHFSNGRLICYFETIFEVRGIRMQNGIISESACAAEGATVMPPGYYAFGSAYDDVGELRLMVNLAEGDPSYGKIFVWALTHNPKGADDTPHCVGFVADSLNDFVASLDKEDALKT